MRRHRVLPSFFLAILTVACMFCLSLFQITGAVAAPRLLGRLAAASIELDRWLPAHLDDIESSARERPRASIEVTGLPITVFVPATSVMLDGGAHLQAAIETAMGSEVYRNGEAAFHGDGGLSVTEPSRWTIELLGPSLHKVWEFLSLAFLAALVIQATLTAVIAEGARLPGVLKPIAAGGAITLVLSAVLWVAFRAGALLTGASVNGEVLLIGRDAAGISLRDGLAVGLGAGAVLMLLRIAAAYGVAGQTDRTSFDQTI